MSDKYINDGGPAFPLKEPVTRDALGMSLRDYFAAKAMAAFIAEPLREGESSTAWRWTRQLQVSGPDIIAHAAYMMADAMLKAREQEGDWNESSHYRKP